jgi:ABC-type transport system involved in multi-copper enzyme maturation permease subunit
LLGPIFVREWLTVPRRVSHYVTRSVYVGALWVLGLTAWQATIGWSHFPTLGDTSRFGQLLFMIYTFVQLTLLLFFASLSAASAVIHEKERRTFILLLLTDLRNYEIVLGKVLGSLLQIGLLLAGLVPVLALLVLLGGVSLVQVVQMMLVLSATGWVAGALGGLIALWVEKRYQAMALTLLFLVLYLGLAVVPAALLAVLIPALLMLLRPLIAQRLGGRSRWAPWLGWAAVLAGAAGGAAVWWGLHGLDSYEAWEPTLRSWLNPYLAWQSVLLLPPEEMTSLAAPVFGFATAMLLLGLLLNLAGILGLRVWNPSGEPIMQREQADAEAEEKDRLKAHAAPGRVRHVWANPILWREIRTRAYGRRPLVVKVAYFAVLALICYFVLGTLLNPADRPLFAAAYGLVPVGVLSLLLISTQAVTAITSERDTGALDLLLVTDLSPKEFIFGKLAGIVYNTKEFLLPPLLLAIVYAVAGLLATPPRAHPELLAWRNTESLVCVLGVTLLLLAFAMVFGLHVALRTQNSRFAVINTLGTVFFLSVGTLICVYLILINGGRFEYQWTSFIFFIAAGVGGLWWVLSSGRPSAALTLASWLCPLGVFYTVTNLVVAKPGTQESADPAIPFFVLVGAFGFTLLAMLVPLVSEFDIALGRTTGGGE